MGKILDSILDSTWGEPVLIGFLSLIQVLGICLIIYGLYA